MDPQRNQEGLSLDLEGIPPSPLSSRLVNTKRNSLCSGQENARQESHLRSSSTTVLPLPHFSSPEERRYSSFGNRSGSPEQSHQLPYLCAHKSPSPSQNSNRSVLDGFPGYQGCFPACSSQEESAQVSSHNSRQSPVLFQNPPIWSDHFSQNVHLPDEAPPGSPPRCRHPCHCLLGRFVSLGGLTSRRSRFHSESIQHPGGPRVLIEYAEIHSDPYQITDLAGDCVEFGGRNGESPRDLCTRDCCNGARDASPRPNFSPPIRVLAGQDSLCIPALSTSSPPLTRGGEAPAYCTQGAGQSSVNHSSTTLASPPSVGRTPFPGSPSSDPYPASRGNDLVRRINNRMGFLHLDGPSFLGPVVPCPVISPYKSTGNSRSSPFANQSSPRHVLPSHVRQQNYGIRNQPFRLEESVDPVNGGPPLPSSLGREPDPVSPAHPRPRKCSRGPIVKGQTYRLRMGTLNRELPGLRRSSRILRNRLVCNSHEPQADEVCRHVQPPESLGSQCVLPELEPVRNNIPLPSAERVAEGHRETQEVQGSRRADSPQETHSPVVPLISEEVHSSPSSSTSYSAGPRRNRRTLTNALRSLDRLSFLRLAYGAIYPPRVVESLISGYRLSSNRQFEAGWKAFQRWLPVETLEIAKPVFLAFLVHIKDIGLSHHTALSYRNSLKIPLDIAFGINTSDPEFDLLARSHFLANPPVPKIIPAWDLDEAISSLEDKGDLQSLPLEECFLASLFLLAVATGNRASEIANIDRRSIVWSSTDGSVSLHFVPSFLFKNQNAKRSPPSIHIPPVPDSSLCPAAAVRFLLSLPNPLNSRKLLISPSTSAPLTASSCRFWLCKAINWLLPGTIARAHDIRKNSFSMAWVRGVPIEEIMKKGFWSSPSVFVRRYFNPNQSISSTNFVAAGSAAP